MHALELQPDEPLALYDIARLCCGTGRTDKGMDHLERDAGQGVTSRYGRGWVEYDVDFAPLPENPCFKALFARLD